MRTTFIGLAMLLAAASACPAHSGASPPQLRDPTWSPTGDRLGYVQTNGATGRVFVVGLDGDSRRQLTPSQALPYGLTWSPDGRSIAYSSGGDIWRIDIAGGKPIRLTTAPALGACQPAWAPDGKTIAYTVFEGCFRCTRIYGIDAADGGNRRLLADGSRRPAWSRDGSLLLTSLPVTLVAIATGASRSVAGGSFASWSGDHSKFVYAGASGLYLSSPDMVTPPQLVWPSRTVFAFPTLSPFAVQLAAVLGKRVVVGRALSGGPAVTLPRSDSADDAPAWSFRGSLAYVADGPCGKRSEIDIARSDGSKPHLFIRSC